MTNEASRCFLISVIHCSTTCRDSHTSFLVGTSPNILRGQLADYDVVISLKPKVTAHSLQGITRLCAIGRCGVGYDNVDHVCTERGVAVFITPAGVVRPVAESIVLFPYWRSLTI